MPLSPHKPKTWGDVTPTEEEKKVVQPTGWFDSEDESGFEELTTKPEFDAIEEPLPEVKTLASEETVQESDILNVESGISYDIEALEAASEIVESWSETSTASVEFVPEAEELNEVDVEENEVSAINHPAHYACDANSEFEAINVIEDYLMNFSIGNAYKYVMRAGKKSESSIEDLEKALWYLNREKEFNERTGGPNELINETTIDPFDVIEAFKLDFFKGTVVQCILTYAQTASGIALDTAISALERIISKEKSDAKL